MADGIIRTCERCKASYGQYSVDKESNFTECWTAVYNPGLEEKGLCQFCNPKTKYYSEEVPKGIIKL